MHCKNLFLFIPLIQARQHWARNCLMRKQNCGLENGTWWDGMDWWGNENSTWGQFKQSRSLQGFLKHPESVGLPDELGLCQVKRSPVGDNKMRRGRQTAGELPLHQAACTAEIPLLMMCLKHLYLIPTGSPGKSYESPSGTQSFCPPGLGFHSPLIWEALQMTFPS